MPNEWYEINIAFASGMTSYVCHLDCSIEDFIKKDDSEFIKLIDSRWLANEELEKPNLVKVAGYRDGYDNYFYLRKSLIEGIWPIKKTEQYEG